MFLLIKTGRFTLPEEKLNLLSRVACGAEYTDFYELARIPPPMLSRPCARNGCAVCDVCVYPETLTNRPGGPRRAEDIPAC